MPEIGIIQLRSREHGIMRMNASNGFSRKIQAHTLSSVGLEPELMQCKSL